MNHKLLIYIAEKAGVYGKLQSSTIKISKDLGLSQQSISRILKELEDNGFIERNSTSKGVLINLTQKAVNNLKKELEILEIAFKPLTQISGKVSAGLGEGGYYINVYSGKISEKTRFKPFPGTMNIKVEKELAQKFISGLEKYRIEEFRQKERTFGGISLYPIRIGNIKAAILLADRSRYNFDTLEIISKENLRKALKIKDGDKVEIERG